MARCSAGAVASLVCSIALNIDATPARSVALRSSATTRLDRVDSRLHFRWVGTCPDLCAAKGPTGRLRACNEGCETQDDVRESGSNLIENKPATRSYNQKIIGDMHR